MGDKRYNRFDKKKKTLLLALEKHLGVVSYACKDVGIDRATYYNWFNKDEEFKKRVEEINEGTVDFVESKLHKKIDEGDTTAIIFYLKTKAKSRGYVERTETDINIVNDIKNQIKGIFPKVVKDDKD